MDWVGKQSLQKKIERVRPPRVQITYDVTTSGAIEHRELPFEVLILAELSGQPASLKPLRDRTLVNIDIDSFDDVLSKYAPRLVFKVANKLGGDETTLAIELQFLRLEDFAPGAVVNQIEPLKRVLHERSELRNRIIEADV